MFNNLVYLKGPSQLRDSLTLPSQTPIAFNFLNTRSPSLNTLSVTLTLQSFVVWHIKAYVLALLML